MFGLQLLELIHEQVEFSVADFRLVEHIVEVFVSADPLAQLFSAALRTFCGRCHLDDYTTNAGGTKTTPNAEDPEDAGDAEESEMKFSATSALSASPALGVSCWPPRPRRAHQTEREKGRRG